MCTRVSTRQLTLLALIALGMLWAAPASAKGPTRLERFRNVLGSRVELSRTIRLRAAWAAAKEPDLVGPSSRAFKGVFLPAWKKLAPSNVEPFFIGGSGSETNNAVLHELAAQTMRRRAGPKVDPRQARVLVLEGAFVARNGPYAEVGFQRASHSRARRDVLPSALYQQLEDKSLGSAEKRTLALLDQRLARDKKLGAVLLEPIPSAHGVLFYRPAFLRGVRALCDKHGVPLVFDEVYTAGGVTGKFFAYQHYGVEPDVVTFGKGLMPGGAGVARVQRQARPALELPAGLTGFKVDPAMLHKAALVLGRIERKGLIEAAELKGRLLRGGLEALQRSDAPLRPGPDGRLEGGTVRGVGLLVHGGELKSADGKPLSRLQPPLDTSTRELERFLRELAGP